MLEIVDFFLELNIRKSFDIATHDKPQFLPFSEEVHNEQYHYGYNTCQLTWTVLVYCADFAYHPFRKKAVKKLNKNIINFIGFDLSYLMNSSIAYPTD